MSKILTILILAAVVESIGVALLSAGIKEINGANDGGSVQIVRLAKSAATNGKILVGLAFEAAFFGALLYMLSQRDVSFIWPLTSLGFIFTTLAAQFLLRENVTPMRWAGVLLIALGAFLTSYSEASRKPATPQRPTTATASVDSSPLRPQ